jgi:hypothetical protein
MHESPIHPRHRTETRPLGLQSLESLPPTFDRELLELDALLQRHVARTSVPRNLADAVYDVTIGLLWKRQSSIPMHSAGGRALHVTAWSRLSMAAAVAMAFVVSGIFMQVPLDGARSSQVAGLLSSEVEGVLFEPGSGSEDLWYLFETRDATFDDLEGDVRDLLQELEL